MLTRIKDRYNTWKTQNHVTNLEVTIGALYASVLVTMIGLGIKAILDANKDAEERNQWIADELAAGRQVYQTYDGSLISTEQAIIRW
jgi:adenosyl cobinamide kinase/adenosyl cobinamide phosphate guanylyltransferase